MCCDLLFIYIINVVEKNLNLSSHRKLLKSFSRSKTMPWYPEDIRMQVFITVFAKTFQQCVK
jgi:hypothetical protein